MKKIVKAFASVLRVIGMAMIIPSFLMALPGMAIIFISEVIDEESENEKIAKYLERKQVNEKV
jgi:uncharacterized membrane protein